MSRSLVGIFVLLPLISSVAADIPSGYARLACLESTGVQYINTGISADAATSATLDWRSDKESGSAFQSPLGAMEGKNNKQMLTVIVGSANNFQYGIFWNSTPVDPTITWKAGERHTVGLDAATGKVSYDGSPVATATVSSYVSPVKSLPIYLFARNKQWEGADASAVGALYGCTIVTNGVPARDFVPAIELATGKPGLYDRVSGAFFTNEGNGDDFVTTCQKVPERDIDYCEYIESDGAGYIDTGVVPGAGMVVDVDWLSNKDAEDGFQVPFGLKQDDASFFHFYIGQNNQFAAALSGSSILNLMAWSKGTRHSIRLDAASMKVYSDAKTLHTYSATPKTLAGTCFLFARNNIGTSPSAYAKGRLYSCRVSEGGVAKHEFLPAKFAGLIGVYDRNTGLFHRGSNDANFTAGGSWKYGHKVLDYLESTGTQYVVTGFVPRITNTTVEVDWTSLKKSGEAFQVPVGARSDNYDNHYFHFYIGSANTMAAAMTTLAKTDLCTWNTGDRKVVRLDGTSNKVVVDGVEKAAFAPNQSCTYPGAFYLFARNNNGGEVTAKCTGRLHGAKFYQDGILMRDFVPVRRNSDGEGVLYDRVFGMYYENAGTGSFLMPPPNGLMLLVR